MANIKLTYTKEMQEQDKLWNEDSEDYDIMEKLYNDIIAEARQKGFNGVVDIYRNYEVVAGIFESEEEKEKLRENDDYITMAGYCKPLIKALEDILNK